MNFKYLRISMHLVLFVLVSNTIKAMQEVEAPQGMSKGIVLPKQPQTLCQLFGLSGLETSGLKDVRSIIAQKIVGEGGWWYTDTTWRDETTHLIAVSPNGSKCATAMYTKQIHALQDQMLICVRDVSQKSVQSLSYPDFFTQLRFIDNDVIIFNGAGTCRNVRWHLDEEGYVVPEMSFPINQECHISACSAHLETPELLVRFNSNMVYLCSSSLTNRRSLCELTAFGFAQFHPFKEIAIIHGNDGLSAFDFNGKLISSVELDRSFFNPILAFKSDMVLLSDRYRGTGIWNIKNNSFAIYQAQGTSLFHDVVFHSQKDAIVGIGNDESVCLWNMDGRKLRRFPHETKISTVCFARSASTLGTSNGNDCVIWQEFKYPTLDQVLLRLLINRYVQNCKKHRVHAEICAQTDQMVMWLTSTFNLQEDCVKNAWQGMPERMQACILAKMKARTKF